MHRKIYLLITFENLLAFNLPCLMKADAVESVVLAKGNELFKCKCFMEDKKVKLKWIEKCSRCSKEKKGILGACSSDS